MRRQNLRTTQSAFRRPRGDSNPLTLVQDYDSEINPSRPAKSSPLGSSTIAGLPLEILDRLKAFPLFRAAPESFLLSIGRSLRPNVYQPNQEIIREGEDAKAMYWLVRGSVRVTSRDGESTYAELKPGAFFGEIGILMDVPRTASVVAAIKSMVVRLNKEDLRKELPNYPDIERSIREEALERLAITERKKKERTTGISAVEDGHIRPTAALRKRSHDWMAGDVEMGEAGSLADGEVLSNKKRKSPSPGIIELTAPSAVDNTPLTIRQLLKELPLFRGLPSEILHYLGVNAQPVTFAPFTEILQQGSSGRDVYFIVKGDVEVLQHDHASRRPPAHAGPNGAAGLPGSVKARLTSGQYFGEVTSLSLAPRRTATVRSVNEVECLLITGIVLDELWQMCGTDLRQQVESEARRRLKTVKHEDDVEMRDAGMDAARAEGAIGLSTEPIKEDGTAEDNADDDWRKGLSSIKFEMPVLEEASQPSSPLSQMEPIDPDPFFNAELANIRAKSRRSSLAPPTAPVAEQISPLLEQRGPSPPTIRLLPSSPLKPRTSSTASPTPSTPVPLSPTLSRRQSLARVPSSFSKGRLPDTILVSIFQHLDLLDIMRFRLVSTHWWDLLNSSPDILHNLNLSMYNKYVTDDVLRNIIVPFTASRPKEIDLSNCFHVTDEGFKPLAEACGEGARVWKMKSVWDVQGPAVLQLVERAKGLEEIDLSNCRKVGDNLLARVVGWIVPEKSSAQFPPQPPPPVNKRPQRGRQATASPQPPQPQPPPGTAVGASKLKRLTLSYCKHIQDRSMAHIAVHASDRLEILDLTRCTSISDAGFHSWSIYEFKQLWKLILADCTYLSDQAIVGIVGGCRNLRELDLSFCCALSDTATEVLALGLPALRSLNMAFCGSAVSDNSLRCIGLHLSELRYLSVRGCVRVTGQGVESVVEGCLHLRELDVSQCKNLRPWLDRGGVQKINGQWGRSVTFDTVADGTWRVKAR